MFHNSTSFISFGSFSQLLSLPLSGQIETHVDGERVRYFQDDDDVGLKEMVRREKMSTPQDQNALYSRMASKVKETSERPCNCWVVLKNIYKY